MLTDESQKKQIIELRNELIGSTGEFLTDGEQKIKSFELLQRNIENELRFMESNIEALDKKKSKLINRINKLKEEIKSLAGKIL